MKTKLMVKKELEETRQQLQDNTININERTGLILRGYIAALEWVLEPRPKTLGYSNFLKITEPISSPTEGEDSKPKVKE